MLENRVIELLWVRKWVDKSCHTYRTCGYVAESQHREVSMKQQEHRLTFMWNVNGCKLCTDIHVNHNPPQHVE